jgi:signal transduction histidine kinase
MGIAHQVATPLGVIVGRAERLAPRVADDDKARRAVAAIADQAARIDTIVRGFLKLARGGTPAMEHVAPGDVARAAVDLVTHRFEKAQVQLSLTIPPDLPLIACDPPLFEQVVVNLLLNACDACVPGGRVGLAVVAEGARGAVAFVVDDDGSGLSPEAASRAKEPFYTTKTEGEGTGLGLAIASEIVAHHHGSLALSPLAVGTRARVEVAALAGEPGSPAEGDAR